MNKCTQPNNAFFTDRLRRWRAVAVGGIGKTVSSDTIRSRVRQKANLDALLLYLIEGLEVRHHRESHRLCAQWHA